MEMNQFRQYVRFDLSDYRDVTAAGYNSYSSPSLHPNRIMPEHDLVYLVDGGWEICQNSNRFYLTPGDVLILSAGQHHFGEYPCMKDTKTIYIHMSVSEKDYIGNESSGKYIPLFHCQHNASVQQFFTAIVRSYYSVGYEKEAEMSALSQLLLRELQLINELGFEQDSLSERAVQYILSNSHKICTAQEISQAVQVSERTLRNYFIKSYGVTPYKFQMKYKLNQVCRSLMDFPQMTLYDIAENFGFCDEYHLSKNFKNEYHISPGAYRKRFLEDNMLKADQLNMKMQ